MANQNLQLYADHQALTIDRKTALKRVLNGQMPVRRDLDSMMIPHPFREREVVKIGTLIAQIEATSEMPECGPGMPQESRYLALLELACSHMTHDDETLFRHASGIDFEGIETVLRQSYGLHVRFIMPDYQVA